MLFSGSFLILFSVSFISKLLNISALFYLCVFLD